MGRAVLFRPNDPVAHFDLGRALALRGKTEAARQAYLRALALSPRPEFLQALTLLPPLPPSRNDFQVGQILHLRDQDPTAPLLSVSEVKKGGFGAVYVVENVLSSPRRNDIEGLIDRHKRIDMGENALGENDDRSALKTFQARYLWSDEDRRRFEREALHWIMLDRHPNIVSAQAIVIIEGFPCLWLEYLPYSLADLLLNQQLSLRAALEMSLQFCDAMFYANQKMGLVHRDIKPSNCLLSGDRRTLKVCDWGLSRAIADAGTRSLDLTGLSREVTLQVTSVAGTLQYMAPEQFSPESALDTRTDIYSFGIMLYQMLTLDLPPIGNLAYSHITQNGAVRQIPKILRSIVLRCVQSDPAKRPDTFHELRALLATAYQELTGTEAPPEARSLQMTGEDWSDKGFALSRLGYDDEACICYERAVEISPTNAVIWMNYSETLIQLCRLDRAWESLGQGLQIDPEHPGLWRSKGRWFEKTGNLEAASDCFMRGIELESKSGGLFHYFRTRDYIAMFAKAGKLELALQTCDEALDVDERDAELWCYKARLLCQLGRHEEALPCCSNGLEIEPRNPDLWHTRAVALRFLRRFEEALIACNKAIEIDPTDANIWKNKGVILGALGTPVEADECFERAKMLN